MKKDKRRMRSNPDPRDREIAALRARIQTLETEAQEGLPQRLLENSPVGLLAINLSRRIVFANPMARQILGLDKEADLRDSVFPHPQWRLFDLEGTPLNPDDLPCWRVLEAEETLSDWRHLIEMPGGRRLALSVNVTPLHTSNGVLEGMVLSVAVIDEWLKVIRALQESESKYRGLFDYANDAIFLVQKDRFDDCNPKTLEMFGCRRDQIIGKLPSHFSPPEQSGGPSAALSQARIDAAFRGQPQRFEWKHSRLDGTVFDAEVSLNLLPQSDPPVILAMVRDITERKTVQEELSFKNAVLKTQQEASTEGILVVGTQGQVLSYNRRFAEVWRFSEHPTENMEDEALLAQAMSLTADPAGFFERVNYLYEHPEESSRELIRLKDGRLLERFSTPMLLQPSGENIGRVWFFRDITETYLAQERLTSFLDASPVAIMLWNRELKLVECNRAALDYLQADISIDEALGQSLIAYRPELEGSTWHQAYLRVMGTGQSFQHDEVLQTPQGERFFYVRAFMAGDYLGLIAADITERKALDQELDRLRSRLSNMIDAMPSMIVGVDRAQRVIQWNRQAALATGIEGDDVLGKPLLEVLPRLSPYSDDLATAMERGEIISHQKVRDVQSGDGGYYSITFYPLVTDVPEGVVIRIDDITERIRLEEMMIQSEKMLSVGGLAAGMAHEINNPLAGILQNVQVMRQRLTPDLPKNIQVAQEVGVALETMGVYLEQRGLFQMMETILESGQRAARIVDNMLSFSRKSVAELVPASLTDLLDQTLELVSSDYDMKKNYDFRKIQIVRDYEPGLPLVRCDAGKIQQVFFNIFKNGAQAMFRVPASSTDGCHEAPRFNLKAWAERGRVVVEIQDNGPGMEEGIRRRIFEPFFTTKPVGTGTGLGLSVSYFIITENHRGQMSVHSAPGRGTRFVVELPVEDV